MRPQRGRPQVNGVRFPPCTTVALALARIRNEILIFLKIKALRRVMTALLKDDTELFKQFSDNESFRRWLTDTIFAITYEAA